MAGCVSIGDDDDMEGYDRHRMFSVRLHDGANRPPEYQLHRLHVDHREFSWIFTEDIAKDVREENPDNPCNLRQSK